jgi:hypothetical protein
MILSNYESKGGFIVGSAARVKGRIFPYMIS